MIQSIIDKLQWAFDKAYGCIPRSLAPLAVEPLLVGHRGVFEHPDLRENTLPAFDLALAHGGGIELDVHLTADGIAIVHHDATLARVHGAPFAAADLTLDQLLEVAPAVPTFAEVLQRYGHQCPHYFVEPKLRAGRGLEPLLSAVKDEVERHRLYGSTTLISSDTQALDVTRRVAPRLSKALIFFVGWRSAERYVRRHGDTGLAGWYFTYPEAARPFLESRSLHVGVGQVDYPNTYRHFRNRGFRYHFTNRIDRLVKPVEPLVLPPLPALVAAKG